MPLVYPQHFEGAPRGTPVNFAPIHQFIDNNVQCIECIDNLAGEMWGNTDAMIS